MSSATVGLVKPPMVGVSTPVGGAMEPPTVPGAARKRKKKMVVDGMKPSVNPSQKPGVGMKPKPGVKGVMKDKDPMVEMMGGLKPMDKKEKI